METKIPLFREMPSNGYFQILNKTEVYMEKLIICYHLLSLDQRQLTKNLRETNIFHLNMFWTYEHFSKTAISFFGVLTLTRPELLSTPIYVQLF